ncbi:MAG: hypothetical protein ABI439_11280 [Rhodospirillales bacterium]
MLRLFAVVALLLIASAAPSYSQQHWLVGSWKGALSGLGNVPYGTERTLTIAATDGTTAKGQWIGPQLTQNVTITISGDSISFATPGSAGATYKMTHKGNALDGTWTGSGSGKSGPISLSKQ